MNVHTSVESKRGCGYRKQGGLYMVGGEVMVPCTCLPAPLDVCPTCHAGIKFSRGWTWVNPQPLMNPCQNPACILHTLPERAGLIWVGEKFYPTPHDFLVEAAQMGISRRITAIPRDLKVGETLVLFAHRKAFGRSIPDVRPNGVERPGIFSAFIPSHIEYVVKETDTREKLESLSKRGVSLVHVIRDIDVANQPLSLFPESAGMPS